MAIPDTEYVKMLLEKYADPIVKKVMELSRDEWEKFKINFEIVFKEYLKNAYDKYSKIKTILYKTEPKYIYDFFEIPTLEKGRQLIEANQVNEIIDISHYIIIQGTGGIGKSTLMKHLFLNELEQKDLIPVFLELKDINDIKEDYAIEDLIFEKLMHLGSGLKRKYIEYALKSGCFLFLLDGYDEIVTDKKDGFLKKLEAFCDGYSQNYFVIASRPYSEFIEFQRFTVLTACALTKKQAIHLIEKIDFDKEIKQRFIQALDSRLYEKHRSFASNPLLLNIMLLTFDNYAEIPEKLHLFYANAFETLYSRHDATKSGYRRELKSKLPYDAFKKVFSYFCFMTYAQGKIEFSYDELAAAFKKITVIQVGFDVHAYIDDLVHALCVLYKDGLNYKFVHRSFQEYFTAFFLKELPDESMRQLGMQLIDQDALRASRDDVFTMLYDMAEDRTEQNILLPLLQKVEEGCMAEDKYDFYYQKVFTAIKFDSDHSASEEKVLWKLLSFSREIDRRIDMIRKFARFYRDKSEAANEQQKKRDRVLLKYLTEHRDYHPGEEVDAETIRKDGELFTLFQGTWIGEEISFLAGLRKRLEKKQQKMELDLSDLLTV